MSSFGCQRCGGTNFMFPEEGGVRCLNCGEWLDDYAMKAFCESDLIRATDKLKKHHISETGLGFVNAQAAVINAANALADAIKEEKENAEPVHIG